MICENCSSIFVTIDRHCYFYHIFHVLCVFGKRPSGWTHLNQFFWCYLILHEAALNINATVRRLIRGCWIDYKAELPSDDYILLKILKFVGLYQLTDDFLIFRGLQPVPNEEVFRIYEGTHLAITKINPSNFLNVGLSWILSFLLIDFIFKSLKSNLNIIGLI